MKKVTRSGMGVLVCAVVLAMPAQADFKTSQADFVIDCNDGAVSVPAGTQLEVFNFGGGTGQIIVDCTVTLKGEDSEIQIEEFNHLEAGGDILVTGDGDKSQVQSKKEVTLVAGGNITLSASFTDTNGEVQAEDDNTFTAGGNITLRTGPNSKLEVKKGYVFTAGGIISILPGAGSSCKVEPPAGFGSDVVACPP